MFKNNKKSRRSLNLLNLSLMESVVEMLKLNQLRKWVQLLPKRWSNQLPLTLISLNLYPIKWMSKTRVKWISNSLT